MLTSFQWHDCYWLWDENVFLLSVEWCIFLKLSYLSGLLCFSVVLFVLPKEVTRMAKYTLEEIMCGEKYNIESDVFMEVFRLVEQKTDAKLIREQLNTIYVKHALLVAKKMHDEGDCISDDGITIVF